MAVVTLVVDFSTQQADGCSGYKLEIPDSEISSGDQIDIRLWGMSPEALEGWSLYEGTECLGLGTLQQVDGEEFEQQLDWQGEGSDSLQLDWPTASIQSVSAVGELLILTEDGVFESWATRGAEVTDRFSRRGYSCLTVKDGTAIYGTTLCRAIRTTWQRVWPWTVPAGAAGDQWFMLHQNGILKYRFALNLPDLAASVRTFRDVTFRVTDFSQDTVVPGASIYIDGLLAGVTNDAGMLSVPNVLTGERAIRITCFGWMDSDQDDLSNDKVVIY